MVHRCFKNSDGFWVDNFSTLKFFHKNKTRQFFHPKVFPQNFPTIESLNPIAFGSHQRFRPQWGISTSIAAAADFWEAEMTSGSSKGLFQMMLGTHHDVSPKSIYFVIVDWTYYYSVHPTIYLKCNKWLNKTTH